jgi:hypothetical protein
MKRRTILIVIGIVVLLGGWFLFRPELLFINATVNETFPTASAGTAISTMTLAEGSFHDVAHKGAGSATLFQLPDGKRVLRFTNFETSNGPDVRVYLGTAPDASDSDTVKNSQFVDLGALKGNVGDQNYDIPSDLDISKYNSVTIWCRRFGVNFATAPLNRR